jgi:hypothetical protein
MFRKIKDWFIDRSSKGKRDLELVSINPNELKSLKYQTEKICIAACKKNGFALRDVLYQTKDIQMSAVGKYGASIQFAINPCDEVCIHALIEDHNAIKWVKSPSRKFIMESVKLYGRSLKFVPKELQDEEIVKIASKQDGGARQYINKKLRFWRCID